MIANNKLALILVVCANTLAYFRCSNSNGEKRFIARTPGVRESPILQSREVLPKRDCPIPIDAHFRIALFAEITNK
jgi:hypothetical protein